MAHTAPDASQVRAFRLAAQHLSTRLPPGALQKAAGACGVQNTPPGSAALALHARVAGLAPAEVESALLVDKTLLQAWSLRAAPHVFPTADASIFTLGLLPEGEAGTRAFIYGVEPALDKAGISAVEVVTLTLEALERELDGRTLTKDELGVAVAARIADRLSPAQQAAWRSPSWYARGQSLGESIARFCLPVAALHGRVCHAGRHGRQAHLARTDQWLGAPLERAEPERARADLVRRYLHSYGPSTPADLAAWAGIGEDQAAAAWSLVADEFVPIGAGKRPAWLLSSDMRLLAAPPQPAGVRFLPPHDPFLQMRDRSTLIADTRLQRGVWRAAGSPGVVLVGGQAVATWSGGKKGSRLALAVHLFDDLSPGARSEVEAEAAGLAPFRDCRSAEVSFGTLGEA